MNKEQLELIKPKMIESLKNRSGDYPYFFFIDNDDGKEKLIVISKLTENQIRNLNPDNVSVVS